MSKAGNPNLQAEIDARRLAEENELLRRQLAAAEAAKSPQEQKPVYSKNWLQELSFMEKAKLIKELEQKFKVLFVYNDPKSRLMKQANFESAKVALKVALETWVRQNAGKQWRVKSLTPVFAFDETHKVDKSFVDIEFVAKGYVKPNASYKMAINSPTPDPNDIIMQVRVLRADIS